MDDKKINHDAPSTVTNVEMQNQNFNQTPNQNYQNQMPNQYYQNQMPNQYYQNQIPNQVPMQNVPNQGYNQYNQMQQPVIYANQPYMQVNQMMPMMNNNMMQWDYLNGVRYINDPLEELKYAKAAVIKQKIEIFEVISGFELPNRYYVFAKDPQTEQKTFLFKCKEESDVCMRLCCSGSMRSFNMKIQHQINSSFSSSKETFAWLKKPFKCTCCCLARPEMTATVNSQFVGKVFEPCTFGDPLFYVYDKDSKIKWKIHTKYCQCGVCCRDGCGVCSEVIFPIYPGNVEEFNQNNSDGFVKKTFKGQELISDSNTFYVEFPSNATAEDKFMIISTVLMIDYELYEENPQQHRHHY